MQAAIYIHVPFCLRRCAYCDFNTYAGLLHLRGAYVRALLREVGACAASFPNVEAQTLYFGGGTPSLLAPTDVAELIGAVRRTFRLSDAAEVTLEANPGTLSYDALAALRSAGVNRLSLGAQSADPRELGVLGRIHLWSAVEEAVRWARAAGLDNLSLDLMLGLPAQTLSSAMATLHMALGLQPDHLSMYMLTLEQGTPLAVAVERGVYPSPDPDLAADMYLAVSEAMVDAGYWQYEISNWAKGVASAHKVWELPPGGSSEGIGSTPCEHNLIYWRNTPWLGFGAGAHSWFAGRRWGNIPSPEAYIRAASIGQSVIAEEEVIVPSTEWGETMMMGLRLAEGISFSRWTERFGADLRATFTEPMDRFQQIGLLEVDDARVRLSASGRLLGNQVFQDFLP